MEFKELGYFQAFVFNLVHFVHFSNYPFYEYWQYKNAKANPYLEVRFKHNHRKNSNRKLEDFGISKDKIVFLTTF